MGEDEGLAVMMAPEIWIKTGGVSVNENLDHPGNKNTPPPPQKKEALGSWRVARGRRGTPSGRAKWAGPK